VILLETFTFLPKSLTGLLFHDRQAEISNQFMLRASKSSNMHSSG